MFNPNITFGQGGTNPILGTEVPPIPTAEPAAATPVEPQIAAATPVEPQFAAPAAPATFVDPANPNPPIVPPATLAPPPEAALEGKNTFYLLGEALKAKSLLPDDFQLEEASADAAKFVDATGKYFQDSITAIEARTKAQLEAEYGEAAKAIEFYRNGGSLEVLAHLEPFKTSLSYDINAITDAEQQLQLKKVIINQALYVSGTQDEEVRDLAIEGYLAKGSIDNVFNQAKQTIATYINNVEANELQRAQNEKASIENAELEKQTKYVDSIKSYINKGVIGDVRLSPKDIELIDRSIFGAKTAVIEKLLPDNKIQATPVTAWEKFMHNFFNDPETQIKAFYNDLKSGAGTATLKQVANQEYANSIIDTLNARNGGHNTPAPEYQPNGAAPKLLHKIQS